MENRIVRWVVANRVSNRGSRIEIRLSILIVAALKVMCLNCYHVLRKQSGVRKL